MIESEQHSNVCTLFSFPMRWHTAWRCADCCCSIDILFVFSVSNSTSRKYCYLLLFSSLLLFRVSKMNKSFFFRVNTIQFHFGIFSCSLFTVWKIKFSIYSHTHSDIIFHFGEKFCDKQQPQQHQQKAWRRLGKRAVRHTDYILDKFHLQYGRQLWIFFSKAQSTNVCGIRQMNLTALIWNMGSNKCIAVSSSV